MDKLNTYPAAVDAMPAEKATDNFYEFVYCLEDVPGEDASEWSDEETDGFSDELNDEPQIFEPSRAEYFDQITMASIAPSLKSATNSRCNLKSDMVFEPLRSSPAEIQAFISEMAIFADLKERIDYWENVLADTSVKIHVFQASDRHRMILGRAKLAEWVEMIKTDIECGGPALAREDMARRNFAD